MATNIKLSIDASTCKAYGVLPEDLVKQLGTLDLFEGAEMRIDYSNSTLDGDYSRGGGIIQISHEGIPNEQEAMFAAAREEFNRLKTPA